VIRLGLVGLGKIALDKHLPAIAASGQFELAAASTLGPVPDGVPCRVFPDHQAMLDAVPGIEAVAVCTPPIARHAIARDALLAGKHVLLEKPTTATLAEAEDLACLARETGRVAFASWHSRFNAAVEEAKRVLAGRRVTRMAVEWREDVEKWHPGQDWIWRPGGFGVFDPGINALSIVTEVMPHPLFIRDCRLVVRSGEDTPVAAELRFGATHSADLSATFDWRPAPDLRTIGIDAANGPSVRLSASGRTLDVSGRRIVAEANTEYPRMYRHFAGLIEEGRSDFDLAPLRLVADAFLMATIERA
jgi:D-galactose 1-dehydrogenase